MDEARRGPNVEGTSVQWCTLRSIKTKHVNTNGIAIDAYRDYSVTIVLSAQVCRPECGSWATVWKISATRSLSNPRTSGQAGGFLGLAGQVDSLQPVSSRFNNKPSVKTKWERDWERHLTLNSGSHSHTST